MTKIYQIKDKNKTKSVDKTAFQYHIKKFGKYFFTEHQECGSLSAIEQIFFAYDDRGFIIAQVKYL